MNAETIKDFLVSLGFGIDEAGYEKFESVLAGVTANAIKTGLAVEGAALSVVAFTAKIASGLDNLYWASQRTGATVQGIQSIGYAVSQVGGSVDAARTSLKAFGEMAGMARDKIGSNLAEGMAGSIDNLRKRILENFPKIESTITKIVKGILWLGDIVGRVAFRIVEGVGDIIDWWGKLDKETKTLIEVIGGLVVAMRILNSTFWMSPVGLITGLIVAFGLLWEDYKTWKEGGNSLIDWEKWQPAIDKAKDAMVWLRDHLLELKDSIGGWKTSLELLATFIAGAWISKVTGAFARLAGIPMPPWLKGWMAYAAYLYDDRENIVASAQSSIDYAKQNIGDGMRALGIDKIGRAHV